jgi:hypothetical protein
MIRCQQWLLTAQGLLVRQLLLADGTQLLL